MGETDTCIANETTNVQKLKNMKSASASSFFCWRQERKTVQALPLEPEQLRSIEYMFTHNLAERKHEGTRSQKLRTRVSSRQVLRQLELIRFQRWHEHVICPSVVCDRALLCHAMLMLIQQFKYASHDVREATKLLRLPDCDTRFTVAEGSLEVKLPTIWTDEKQRRSRRIEKRRKEREKIREEKE